MYLLRVTIFVALAVFAWAQEFVLSDNLSVPYNLNEGGKYDLREAEVLDTLTTDGLTVEAGAEIKFILDENLSLPPQYRW